jgi:hypothetical protein
LLSSVLKTIPSDSLVKSDFLDVFDQFLHTVYSIRPYFFLLSPFFVSVFLFLCSSTACGRLLLRHCRKDIPCFLDFCYVGVSCYSEACSQPSYCNPLSLVHLFLSSLHSTFFPVFDFVLTSLPFFFSYF